MLSFFVSYDSRRRIIYYETLRTEIERLLADDEARQGIRSRVNIRPFKYTSIGLSYAKRFQASNQNKSDNINGYFNYSKLPGIGGRISVNYNLNQSNYNESNVLSIRHSRSLIKRKLQGDFYFRMSKNNYIGSENTTEYNYYGASFSYRLSKSLRFSLLSELSTTKERRNIRLNTKLIKRFDKK
jgi:hypothetical protein